MAGELTRLESGRAPFPAGVEGLRVRWVTTGGLRARCVEAGADKATPVVMMPGWGCTAYTFRRNIPALVEAGWRVIVIEPPGQGYSEKPLDSGAYGLTALMGSTLQLFDQLGLESPAIIGQSLGGRVALQIASESPDRVSRLVLWSPVGFGCSQIVYAGSVMPTRMSPLLERVVGPALVGLGLRIVYGSGHPPTADDVREYAAPLETEGYVRSQLELLRNVHWGPVDDGFLARLTLPVLVVTGTADPLIPWKGVRDAVPGLPNARLHLVRGAGHAANETHSGEVNRQTLGFVRVPDGFATG
ncbi:MAG TPA: alpha/beta hydrolase [Gemmatimonadaceae bacterium]|nr:alpha/beta hydrolase [Gemmatimonadaceae bacterium]